MAAVAGAGGSGQGGEEAVDAEQVIQPLAGR
jgi:hypothetical protein